MRQLPLPWEDAEVAEHELELSEVAIGCRSDWLLLARTYPRRSVERRNALARMEEWEDRAFHHTCRALYLAESAGQA